MPVPQQVVTFHGSYSGLSGFAAVTDNGWFDIGQLVGGVGVARSEQQLQRHTLPEQACRNVGRGDLARNIGIFIGIVKSGQDDGVRQLLRIFIQILSDKMSHIIADAYKSRRPAGQGVQKGRNLPVIGEDIQAAGQAVFRANGKLISVHALTIAEIALLIRLRVADVADKTNFLMAVLNQEYYRNRPVTL